jgi:hypothetical protein
MKNAIKLSIILGAGLALFFIPKECEPQNEGERYTVQQSNDMIVTDAFEVKTT